MKFLRLTKTMPRNEVLSAVEADDYIRENVVTEYVRVAITELDAVEREIGVPSKALPLLRSLIGA